MGALEFRADMRPRLALGFAIAAGLVALTTPGVLAATEGLWFDPIVARVGDAVTVSHEDSVCEDASLYLVPADETVTSVADPRLIPAPGRIREVEGSLKLEFVVPEVSPGRYDGYVWCEAYDALAQVNNDLTIKVSPPPTDTVEPLDQRQQTPPLVFVIAGLVAIGLAARLRRVAH